MKPIVCGVYGFLGKPTKKTPKIIRKLGLLNESRGRDSTGLAFVTTDKGEVYKNTLASHQFFTSQPVIELLCKYRKKDYVSIMGHTRQATHGSITPDNAHPFDDKGFVFSHNGIIWNFESLAKKYNLDYEVDSQIIGYLLNERPTIKDAFNELTGMFTVPFINYENDPETLNVAVYNQVFSYAKRGNQLYYSSEIADLKKALEGQTGFDIVDGRSNNLYRFYLLGQEVVISKEDLGLKSYFRDPYNRDHMQNEQDYVSHILDHETSSVYEARKLVYHRDCKPNRCEFNILSCPMKNVIEADKTDQEKIDRIVTEIKALPESVACKTENCAGTDYEQYLLRKKTKKLLNQKYYLNRKLKELNSDEPEFVKYGNKLYRVE